MTNLFPLDISQRTCYCKIVLGKIRNYLASSQHSKLLPVIAIIAIILAVPLTVILSQQRQDLRQRADELSPNCTVTFAWEDFGKGKPYFVQRYMKVLDKFGQQGWIYSINSNEIDDNTVTYRDKDVLSEANSIKVCEFAKIGGISEQGECKEITQAGICPASTADLVDSSCLPEGERTCVSYKNINENQNRFNKITCDMDGGGDCTVPLFSILGRAVGTDRGYMCYQQTKEGESCVSRENKTGTCSGQGICEHSEDQLQAQEISISVQPSVAEQSPTVTAAPTYTISGKVSIVNASNSSGISDSAIYLTSEDNSNFGQKTAVFDNNGNYSFPPVPSGNYKVKLSTKSLLYYDVTLNPVEVKDLSANKVVNFVIALREPSPPISEPEVPTEIPTEAPKPVVLDGNFDFRNNCLDINDFNVWLTGFQSGRYSLSDYNKWYREFSNEANRCK